MRVQLNLRRPPLLRESVPLFIKPLETAISGRRISFTDLKPDYIFGRLQHLFQKFIEVPYSGGKLETEIISRASEPAYLYNDIPRENGRNILIEG